MCWHFPLLPLCPPFIDAVSFRNQPENCIGHFLSNCHKHSRLPVLTLTRAHTFPRLSPTPSSSFFPSHFLSLVISLTPVLSLLCLMFASNDSWAFYSAVDFIMNVSVFKLSLSFSCLTSSTAPCQLMTAWPLCRSTATSARSSSTNATSEWLAVCQPCCREIPTRPTFLLLVPVREPQILNGGC